MNSRILPAIAFLLAVGIFFVYVNPIWTGSVAEAKAAIENDNIALDASRQYISEQNHLADARDAISSADQKMLATFLPSSVDNVGIILDLNALAARSDISIKDIDVSGKLSGDGNNQGQVSEALPGGTVSPVGSVDMSISASGTFAALKTFLVGLEKSARLLDVRSITVKGSDTGIYDYQITISIYWLR